MNESIELLQKADKILELGNSGFALVSEVDNQEKELGEFLKTNTSIDTLFGRKFDKWNSKTRWKAMYRSKYADKSYLETLQILRDFLAEFIETNDIKIPVEQKFIKFNSVYTGSRIIREVFSKAIQKIDIQDNFVGIRLLDILEEVFLSNPNIEIRLLTKNGNYKDLKPFILEMPVFQQQFPKFTVKSDNQAHGRFIIIDDKTVFNPGASIKDIGKKADLFYEVTEKTAKSELIKDFNDWWITAQIGVSIA